VPPVATPRDALDEAPAYRSFPDFYGNPRNPDVSGWSVAWRDERQRGVSADGTRLTGPHDAVFPLEFRDVSWYARAGMGNLGAGDIADAHAEHKRTDFFSLKDIALDASGALAGLTDCYKYWIALSDCDGFRIDTVKHMALEETRNFCGAVGEFAATLGKRNFLLVGEIAGGDDLQDFVLDHLAVLRRNLSAALDIGSARLILQGVAKGLQPAADYFAEFRESSTGFESHRAFGNRHVSILDDHDHVVGSKVRFSSEIPDASPVKDHQVVLATALQLFTLGIPCIYYGSEQAFAGPAQHQLPFLLAQGWNDATDFGDRYLREAMFGPDHPRAHHDLDLRTQVTQEDAALPGFGAFGTAGRHCFDELSPAYVRIAALCRVRAAHPVLRGGRQYQRQLRLPHTGFAFQPGGELVAWSRILDAEEAVIVANSNGDRPSGGDVVIAAELSGPGAEYVVLVNTAEVAVEAGPAPGTYRGTHPAGSHVPVRGRSVPSEPAFSEIRDVQPAEVLVLLKLP
jgi:glycosidase